MPGLKWMLGLAAVIALAAAFLIKSGLLAPTDKESAVRPGHQVEGYHEQRTSTFLRTKQQLRDIQQKREEEVFW